MKKTMLVMMTLVLTTLVFADIIVGTGSSTGRYPGSSFYNYYRSASLFTGAELNAGTGTITALKWYCSTASTTPMPVKIYMKTQTGTTLATDTWANYLVGATEVFNATVTVSTTGWYSFDITDTGYTSGDNLVVLVETGLTAYTSPYHNWYYTTATGKWAGAYADGTIPATITAGSTRPNITLVGITQPFPPGICSLVYPTPSGVTGIGINPTLQWAAGTYNPTGYDVYFGQTLPPEGSPNVSHFTQTSTSWAPGTLAYNTTYSWKIVPFNAFGNPTYAACPTWTFTTMSDPTLTPPTTQDFTTFPPTNWTRWSGLLAAPSTLTSTTSGWVADGFANVGTTGAARLNIYGTSCQYWLVTPPISLGSKTGWNLEFDLALTAYGVTTAPTGTQADDKFAVVVSTDNGVTWSSANTLRLWDNAGSSYVYNNISLTGEHVTISLAGFSGSVKIGFYGESTVGSNGDNDLFVDNFAISQAGAPPSAPTASVPDNNATGVAINTNLSWSGSTGEIDGYYVYFGTSEATMVQVADVTSGSSYDPPADLAYSQQYFWRIDAHNTYGTTTGTVWNFTTGPDPTIDTFPHTEGFEGGVTLPFGWTRTANGSASYNWEVVTADATHGAAAPYDGTYFARLYVYLASTLYNPYCLVSPPINLSGGSKQLNFWAWIGADGDPAPLDVEISIDGMATWIPLYSFDLTNTNAWINTIISLAGYNSSSAYIRFKATSNFGYGFCDLGLDQIMLEDAPTVPVELSSFSAVLTAENLVNLTWVTQSETGVQGYYIYRSNSEVLEDAILISPLVEATNSSEQHSYSYTDSELFEEGMYYYWLQNVDLNGNVDFHGPVSVNFSTTNEEITPEIPTVTELKSIYPNPFNPTAVIPFSIAKTAKVEIRIFNTRGQLLRHFNLAERAPGYYQVAWDGKDFNGNSCSSGIYYIVMNAGKETFQRKAVLQK